jgi:hypothetical protein
MKPPVVESMTVREMRTPGGEAELPTHVCATQAGPTHMGPTHVPTHVSTAEPAEVPTTTAVSATTAMSAATTSGDCGDRET